MLIAPIDRNKEPEPDKQISRINSPYWTLPANGGLGSPQDIRTPHSTEGVILRVRDTRMMERRKTPYEFREAERRTRDNRKQDSRWNTTSHHVLVIAIERKAGETGLWKTGDRVSVTPRTQTTAPNISTRADTPKEKLPLLVKDEGDYVLHLSKPGER